MTWINEIFCSLQGEGRFSGIPTTFVRFAGCDVRCDGCDTQYAWSPKSGKSMTIEQIMDEIAISEAERVCITGGEPLIQKDAVKKIVDRSPYPVSIETSGMYKFNDVDCPCTIDIKPPSMVRDYTMEHHFNARPMDEFKLVVGTEEDKMFARAAIDSLRDFGLNNTVWISPLWGTNEEELAEWFVENNDKLKGDVRMQLQIHKYIWDPNKRGV